MYTLMNISEIHEAQAGNKLPMLIKKSNARKPKGVWFTTKPRSKIRLTLINIPTQP